MASNDTNNDETVQEEEDECAELAELQSDGIYFCDSSNQCSTGNQLKTCL